MENKSVLENADTGNHSDLSGKTRLKAFFSIFLSLGFAIKVIVLLTLSGIYFIIGAAAVLLYVIFYEKLFKTIFSSLKERKQKSPYYYKWKKHHLELYYEA